jgi:hypothetical protein
LIIRSLSTAAPASVALELFCLATHATEVIEQSCQKDDSGLSTAQILVDGLVLLRQQRGGMVQTDAQFGFAAKVSAV